MPSSVAEGAVIEESGVLITGKVAVFAERGKMKPIAVAVEVIFGKIFVPFDFISGAELFSFGPGFGFDADKLNIAIVGVFLKEIVAELMKELKWSAVGDVSDGGRGRKTETITGSDGEVRVIFAEFICQRV